MNSIYSGLMAGDSTTKTHNRLSVLLSLQFLVMIPRTWVALIQIFDLMFSRMNAFGSFCILANIPGDVVLLVMLLVEMHKRAVGTLSSELFYKLQLGKTGWIVGGWFLLLVVYRGSLVMMVLDWRVWSSLVVDVVYISPFVAALVLVLKEKREEGISLL